MPLLKAELEHWARKFGGQPYYIIDNGPGGSIDVFPVSPGSAAVKVTPSLADKAAQEGP